MLSLTVPMPGPSRSATDAIGAGVRGNSLDHGGPKMPQMFKHPEKIG
jgi:hypothetical protein